MCHCRKVVMNVLASVCTAPHTHTHTHTHAHTLLVIQEPAVSYLSAIHIWMGIAHPCSLSPLPIKSTCDHRPVASQSSPACSTVFIHVQYVRLIFLSTFWSFNEEKLSFEPSAERSTFPLVSCVDITDKRFAIKIRLSTRHENWPMTVFVLFYVSFRGGFICIRWSDIAVFFLTICYIGSDFTV